MQTARYRGCGAALSLALALSLVLPALSLGAQEVDKTELERIDRSGIVFINYEGPVERNETAEAITGIGRELGKAVRSGAKQAGSPYRYFIIHSVSAAEGTKLDADIMGLGIDVGVNHIANLREIIRGYLEEAYGYSPLDARLLAEFITIYNAVYRGNWPVFTERYKKAVVGHLSPEKAGLSVRYDQWPGQTLMVIPLSLATPGRLSAIDTTPLTDKKVIEEVRKQEDLGIEKRKEMVDLKEREANEAEQKATLEREAIRDEEKRIAEEKRAVAEAEKKQKEEQTRIDAEKKALEAEKKKEGADPSAIEKKEEALKEKEEALQETKKETAEKKEAVQDKEKALEERKEEAKKEEKLADKKRDESQEERKDIAKDTQTLIAKEEKKDEEALASGQLGVAFISPVSPIARLVLIDKSNGSEMRRSALETLQGRSVVQTESGLYAVAADSAGTVRLVAMDPKTLEVTAQSEDSLHISSLIWVRGSDLYALSSAEGKTWFARFDKDLKRVARSSIPVHGWATPLFLEGSLLSIQNERGAPVLLRASDLTAQY